eukprot:TRINITY_DN2045_c0_g1_i2.p2 TRINITY_DN2045_c0_g1~~TRINITY_DN2045_c0_g1_i2.p2  ORF type:complete len:138 (-),score=26.65 TRINITY_DN2045_c0_g1_i2:414-827(-)
MSSPLSDASAVAEPTPVTTLASLAVTTLSTPGVRSSDAPPLDGTDMRGPASPRSLSPHPSSKPSHPTVQDASLPPPPSPHTPPPHPDALAVAAARKAAAAAAAAPARAHLRRRRQRVQAALRDGGVARRPVARRLVF